VSVVGAIVRELLLWIERLSRGRGKAKEGTPDRPRLERGGARIRQWLQSRGARR
jgi:hypothetical protein